MYKLLFLIFLFTALQKNSFAQDTLPKITVTQLGTKVLVSWNNPYTSLTAINIQRSADSTRNFTTIGSVLNVKTATNGFVDTKEFIPSDQYYRLFLSFEGGTYIFTTSRRPARDTLNISAELKEFQQPATVKTWFVPSKHIYTGRDNNIIISLPDALKKKYSIKFFEDDGTFIFELRKITDTYLTLDKVNFMHSGLFDFELYDNRILIERHKIYIPKDGKATPALDVNGYEIN
ncbi:MAG: hypothetical protein ABIR03_00880 [Ginsengibacter sp.]